MEINQVKVNSFTSNSKVWEIFFFQFKKERKACANCSKVGVWLLFVLFLLASNFPNSTAEDHPV